jgi:molybdopterin-biosynthesis enzyme MoeA-like protein
MSAGFAAYISGLAEGLNVYHREIEVFDAPGIPTEFQKSVRSITRYPFVTVLEKHAEDQGRLISQKHGTEWQPY